jgi:virginiamycin B lyase
MWMHTVKNVALTFVVLVSSTAATHAWDMGSIQRLHDVHAAPSTAAIPDQPLEIVAGHDGALWFTELNGNRIGRIAVGGEMREYPVPTPRSGPLGIAFGPDNAIWFTESYADQLGRLDPLTGHITEYPIPQLDGQPGRLAVGSDGAIYFAQNHFGSMGRFTPSTGRFAEFGLSSGDTVDLVRGPDGAIWFTSAWGGVLQIGRLGPDGSIAYHQDKAQFGNAASESIVVGPDGALWFTQSAAGAIGRLNMAGVFSRVKVKLGQAIALATGVDGNLWVSLSDGGIGRVSTTGKARVFDFEDQLLDVPVTGITPGPDGNLWCTLPGIDRIGRITPAGISVQFTIPSAPAKPYGLSIAHDGSAWFTLPASNRVGHLTGEGQFHLFAPPTHDSDPGAIVSAPDGSAWFVEYRARRVAHVTFDGLIREYAIPPGTLHPLAIAVAPNGLVWWTEYPYGLLASLDPATGRIVEYPSSIGADSGSIAIGKDGRVWLTDAREHAITRLDPATDAWVTFPMPGETLDPSMIAAVPDGSFVCLLKGTSLLGRITAAGHVTTQNVPGDGARLGIVATSDATYVTETDANAIGRLGKDGAVTSLPIPTANSVPMAMASAPDGGVWFTELTVGRLGRIDPSSGTMHEYVLPTS